MPRRLVGLYYHVVSDGHVPHVAHLYRYKSVAQFRADLVHLKTAWNPVLQESAEDAGSGKPPILVTFDDGLAECATIVAPLLGEAAIPAMFFVSTGFIDNASLFFRHAASLCLDALARRDGDGLAAAVGAARRETRLALADGADLRRRILGLGRRDTSLLEALCGILDVSPEAYLARQRPYLTRVQIVDLARQGFVIGAHGVQHERLDDMPAAAVEESILASCRAILEITGAERVPYAFPHSGTGLDREFLGRILRRHPFIERFYDTRGLSLDAPFIVNRIGADTPPRGPGSNLPEIVREAYAAATMERLGRSVPRALRS